MRGMKSFDGVVSVASACTESWEGMQGDARVRFCGRCEKNVFSLDALTTAEVRDLVLRAEGRICWRFYVRKDGTVLTKDCPVGLRRVARRSIAAAAAGLALLLAGAAGVLRQTGLWDASQVLGSWSARVQPPAPITSPHQKLSGHTGMMAFPADSQY